MGLDALIVLGIGAFIFSLSVLVAWEQPRSRGRRAVARLKNTPIGDVKDGQWAKVTGLAGVGGAQMTSPLGGEACIGFWLEVQRADRKDVNVFTREGCGPFSITDDTGRIQVEGPFLVALELPNDWSEVPREQVGFLEAVGVKTSGFMGNRKLVFKEALLRQGDRVSVLGQASLEPDPGGRAAGSHASARIRRMRGSNRQPVIVAHAKE